MNMPMTLSFRLAAGRYLAAAVLASLALGAAPAARAADPAPAADAPAPAGTPPPRIQMRVFRNAGPGDGERNIVIQTTGEGPQGPFRIEGPGREGPMRVQVERLMRGGPMAGDSMAGGPRRQVGVRLVPLSPRLGSYFGAKSGLLVVKVDNPQLKLEEGDVITAIGGREPTSPGHAWRILRSYEPGEKVPVKLLRDRKPQSIEITVPARPEPRRFELRREGPMPPPAPPAAPPAQHAH